MTRDNDTSTNRSSIAVEEGDSSVVDVGGGEYDWSIGERGLLLSGFFYLYVITQIPGTQCARSGTLVIFIQSHYVSTIPHRQKKGHNNRIWTLPYCDCPTLTIVVVHSVMFK